MSLSEGVGLCCKLLSDYEEEQPDRGAGGQEAIVMLILRKFTDYVNLFIGGRR